LKKNSYEKITRNIIVYRMRMRWDCFYLLFNPIIKLVFKYNYARMKTLSQQIAEIEANAKNVLCPELLCAMNQKYNELKNIQSIMKTEILEAIRKTNFEFDHELEDTRRTSANCRKSIETENYNIEIELRETVQWNGIYDYDFLDMEVLNFQVFNESGEIETEISDLEIINVVQ
jgi:hypothetical protein